jgi:hypothetical protein
MDEQTAVMRGLQREIDDLRDTRSREKEREARRARQDEEELKILHDRCDKLKEEQVNMPATVFLSLSLLFSSRSRFRLASGL